MQALLDRVAQKKDALDVLLPLMGDLAPFQRLLFERLEATLDAYLALLGEGLPGAA